MSQAKVPLEWIHVFYRKWVRSLSLCHFKTKSRDVLTGYVWYVSEGKIHVLFIYKKICIQYNVHKSVTMKHY